MVRGSHVSVVPANRRVQSVCVLHGCESQCGITTECQAGVVSESDEWLGCQVSTWPKGPDTGETRGFTSQLLQAPRGPD